MKYTSALEATGRTHTPFPIEFIQPKRQKKYYIRHVYDACAPVESRFVTLTRARYCYRALKKWHNRCVYIYTHLYTRAQIARDSFFFFVSLYIHIDVDFAHSVHTCRLYFRDERARAFDVSIGALPNREGAAQFPR